MEVLTKLMVVMSMAMVMILMMMWSSVGLGVVHTFALKSPERILMGLSKLIKYTLSFFIQAIICIFTFILSYSMLFQNSVSLSYIRHLIASKLCPQLLY
jgi:hypothetical protein